MMSFDCISVWSLKQTKAYTYFCIIEYIHMYNTKFVNRGTLKFMQRFFPKWV